MPAARVMSTKRICCGGSAGGAEAANTAASKMNPEAARTAAKTGNAREALNVHLRHAEPPGLTVAPKFDLQPFPWPAATLQRHFPRHCWRWLQPVEPSRARGSAAVADCRRDVWRGMDR